jgi:PBP1b-binding outer membrane lipoprotein LpoB
MTKTALLLAIVALHLLLAGCGNSDTQQKPASGKPSAADDTSRLCSSIEGTGLAKQCTVNSRESTVDVMIDSFDDEVARNICADIADKTTQLATHLSGQWKLQVFSPYRSDKPMAACLLN